MPPTETISLEQIVYAYRRCFWWAFLIFANGTLWVLVSEALSYFDLPGVMFGLWMAAASLVAAVFMMIQGVQGRIATAVRMQQSGSTARMN